MDMQALSEAIEMQFTALSPQEQDIFLAAVTPEVAGVMRKIFPAPLHDLINVAEQSPGGGGPVPGGMPQAAPPMGGGAMGAGPQPGPGGAPGGGAPGGLEDFARMVG